MKPVILWTDAFIYLLIIAFIYFLFLIRRSEPLKEAYKQIFKQTKNIVVVCILAVYCFIGFLDTIHFKTGNSATEVKSVLDIVLRPYDTLFEKTYSAPFATHSYSPEVVKNSDGTLSQQYPKLLYERKHFFGTDKVGRDVFYISLKSIRTGLVIGTLTTLVMLPFALFFGMWAGYFRGFIDDFIQYIYTTLNSIPAILLIAAAILSLQVKVEQDADLRLLLLCAVLGMTSWTGLCRLLRGETLKLREAEYIQAAITLGVTPLKIIIRHIMPNLMHIVIISVVLDFSGLVLAEAVLSYVGVGVSPSTYSWGNMINAARLEMARDPIVWWSLLGAFVMMFVLVFCANIFSDAVQKVLDPRAR